MIILQVGVRFDEPVGKSNGYVKGVKYFDCVPKYGGFIRGANLKVGEYPERDLMDELEDDQTGDEAGNTDNQAVDDGDDDEM